jgi:D-sedoheptulose 7-phosphate isomerase
VDNISIATFQAYSEHQEVMRDAEALLPAVDSVAKLLLAVLGSGGCVYAFGNGGSAAEAEHLVAELLGRYRKFRRAVAAVALTSPAAVVTCIGNDFGYDLIFARQLEALVMPRDLAMGFSTSGESLNVVNGLAVARRVGAKTVLVTGAAAGAASSLADAKLCVPSQDPSRIQEVHALLVHILALHVDLWASDNASPQR